MIKKYFERINELTAKLIKNNISKKYVEFKKGNLPNSRGIYFIYKKIGDSIENKPSYIGCAYKKANGDESKKDRSIKARCGQNLEPGNTGATFRNRIIKEEMDLEIYKEIEEDGKKKKVINEENANKGIEYISNNFVLKFIEVDEKISENEVLLLERACINYYNPIHNRG